MARVRVVPTDRAADWAAERTTISPVDMRWRLPVALVPEPSALSSMPPSS